MTTIIEPVHIRLHHVLYRISSLISEHFEHIPFDFGLWDASVSWSRWCPLNCSTAIKLSPVVWLGSNVLANKWLYQVVKIRMQAAKSGTVRYTGTLSAYYKIGLTEGPKGLWSGLGPSIARSVFTFYRYLQACFNETGSALVTWTSTSTDIDVFFINQLCESHQERDVSYLPGTLW